MTEDIVLGADQKQDEQVNEALDAVETDEELIANPVITLRTGVTVRVKPVPDLIAQKIWAQFEEPKPPLVEIESGGKKWKEPNPDDPAYHEALSNHRIALSEALNKLGMLHGFEIVSLPEGMKPYEEDTEWIEECELFGITVPKSGPGRYVEWVRNRVLTNNIDMQRVQKLQNALSGVTPKEVAAALETFRHMGGR